MPLPHQIAAHKSWANTPNRSARTANARNALEQKFLDLADGDPQRAQSHRKVYYLELAKKSAESRRRNRDAKEAARQARIAALLAGDGDGNHAA
jgi:hypothetical protein